jgi:hypothetical protein
MKNKSDVTMLSIFSKIVSHVWVFGVEKKDGLWGRGEASGLWETGQSFFNVEPE